VNSRIGNLIQELRNRSVFRAAVVYCVVCWLLLQVADVTFDRLPIPDGAMTVLIVLVIIGLPVTVVLAWAYEITLRGIVRHEETRGGAPRLAFLPFILLVITVSSGLAYGLYYLSLDYGETEPPSLAVLPFVNMSAAEDGDYFSDGLTEEIQSLMVRLNEFRVVALSSTYELKDKSIDIPTIARRLDVGLLLGGSVRRSGDQVRITARLIDGEDGSEIWSDKYDRKLSDIFAIQEDIAREVAAALQIILPVSLERRLANLGTVNVEAYDLYLRATDFLRQPTDEATLAKTEDYIRQAIAIDPNFARPYAAWCEVYLTRYERTRATKNFEDAERTCHRALTRDTASVDVHLALGRLYHYSGQYNQSITEFEAALAINANLPDAHLGTAKVYTDLNQPVEAEANFRRAIELDASYWASFNIFGNYLYAAGRYLEAAEFFNEYARRAEDNATAYNNLGAAYFLAGEFPRAAEAWDNSLSIKPTSGAYTNTGSMYFYLGQYDTALERYAKAVELAPMDFRLWGNLGDAYYYAGNMEQVAKIVYGEAIKFAEERLNVNAADVEALSSIAYYYSKIGQSEKAIKMNASALANSPDDMYVNYNAALIYAQLGDRDRALVALERAVELDYQPELLSTDPGFSSLREEERFQRLVAKNNP
jgi:TolB-like protein/Tfp pilus assembly protein PilF